MDEDIQPLHLPISMKNIGIPTEFQYLKALVFRIEDFIKRLRWHCFFIGPPLFNPIVYEKDSPQNSQEDVPSQSQNENEIHEKQQWYGFKSENTPPVIKELIRFEEELYKLARNIKFRKISHNEFQNLIKQSVRNVKNSKEMIIPADKSHVLYKIPVPTFEKMLKNEVTKTYKHTTQNEVHNVNKESLKLIQTHEPGLEARVEVFSQTPAFISVKDHKPSFPSKVDVRLLNPAKPQLGKITKVKLQEINSELRAKTHLNQLQSTNDAISWFNALNLKKRRHFLIFDIVSFYPSISEAILKKTFAWARSILRISEADEKLIFMARRSFLFMDNKPWVKIENPTFDVTMGAFDGAEVAEFVGLFILNKLSSIMDITDFALYRDDGICAIKGTKRSANDMLKKIVQVIKEIGLKVDIPPTGPAKSVDFLNLNLNLTTGFHSPYRKPLNVPLFIHKNSNHPPSILKEVPRNVCKLLSVLSSNKEIFDNAKQPYIDSLTKNSGFENVEMNFIPKDESKRKPKKSNTRKVLYCNLPWNMAVKNKIGKEFLTIVDMFKGSPQGKVINRHTIKLSYSTMRNVKSHITSSNLKKLNSSQNVTPVSECKCAQCPVNGECSTNNVVYQADIKTKSTTKSYIGMTARTFIERWKEHRGNIRHKHQQGTKLSHYVWKQNTEFGEKISMENIKWSLKSKTTPYRAGARYCDTCLSEKTHIALANPSEILNSRKEIVSKCPHKRYFKLKYFKPP